MMIATLGSRTMVPLLIRYRWGFAAFVAIHPVVYALLLVLPPSASTVLFGIVVAAAVVLGAAWLVALVFEL